MSNCCSDFRSRNINMVSNNINCSDQGYFLKHHTLKITLFLYFLFGNKAEFKVVEDSSVGQYVMKKSIDSSMRVSLFILK